MEALEELFIWRPQSSKYQSSILTRDLLLENLSLKRKMFLLTCLHVQDPEKLINRALPLVFNERGFAFGSADGRGLSVEHMKN